MSSVKDKVNEADIATNLLATLPIEIKSEALKSLSTTLDQNREKIIEANKEDLDHAKKLDHLIIDKIRLNNEKIDELIKGILTLSKIPDPVGTSLKSVKISENLNLFCISTPIGVISLITEPNPASIVQAASLALITSNALIISCDQNSSRTNQILVDIISKTTETARIPPGWIQYIEGNHDLKKMLEYNDIIKLLLLRGNSHLTEEARELSKIPILGNTGGVCHLYIDDEADFEMGVSICYDSKCQSPKKANSIETIIVHKNIASEFLDKLKIILDVAKVQYYGDDETLKILSIEHASDKDWAKEYKDLKLNIKIVSNIDESIEHINKYGSKFADAIVTKNPIKAKKFMLRVDSANVLWNTSTRFVDGYRYGFGAEITSSTSKIHARGPVGIEGLLIYKWKLIGEGHILSDFTGEKPKKEFIHENSNQEFPI